VVACVTVSTSLRRPADLRRLADEGVEEAQDRLTQIIRDIK
jgi:hypothetical protein